MTEWIRFWFDKPAHKFTTHICSAASAQSGNWFSVSLMPKITVGLMHAMWQVYPTPPHCLMNYTDIIWISTKKANHTTYVEVWRFSAPKMCHNRKHSSSRSRSEVRSVVRWSLAVLQTVMWKVCCFFCLFFFLWFFRPRTPTHYFCGLIITADARESNETVDHMQLPHPTELFHLDSIHCPFDTDAINKLLSQWNPQWFQLSAGWLCTCLWESWFYLWEL